MSVDLGIGLPLPPGERPRKRRAAARVVVVAQGEYLLGERFDPGLPEVRWWTTPGGGIDPGETALDAAIRELAEEVGIDAGPGDLRGPVARRVVIHGYTDQVVEQTEDYFVLELAERVAPDTRLLTEREQVSSGPWRWVAPADLGARWVWDDVVRIHALLADEAAWVVDLGRDEQSSVLV